MRIREETTSDHDGVARVHRLAFGPEAATIVALVEDLRLSLGRDPGLSLVAVQDDGRVVGHVMFTRNVLDAPPQLVNVQVLSPVGVLPEMQRNGVGAALIGAGLQLLGDRGVPLVFLEGDPSYYSRLGFTAGQGLNFRRPSLRIPQPAFQVYPLPGFEPWMTGTLVYRQEFWDHDAVGLRDGG